jgi:uncharacterized protein YxeA
LFPQALHKRRITHPKKVELQNNLRLIKSMKTIIALIGVAIVMGIGFYLYNQESVNNLPGYVKEQVTEVSNSPEIPESWQTDEDAIKAAKDVIRKKELQAELKALDAEIAEKTAKRKEVAKELDSY